MNKSDDLNFLRFFLTEPIYIIPEGEPQPDEDELSQTEQNTLAEVEVPEAAKDHKDEHVQDIKVQKEHKLSPPDTEGSNQQKVLVLFYNQNSKSLPQEERDFLGNILKAVKLNFEDIALCNWASLEHAYEQQKNVFESLQQVQSEKILLFGALPLAWSLSHFFQKYQISQDAEGRKLLQADDLKSLTQNRNLKVQLWNALQKLFV